MTYVEFVALVVGAFLFASWWLRVTARWAERHDDERELRELRDAIRRDRLVRACDRALEAIRRSRARGICRRLGLDPDAEPGP